MPDLTWSEAPLERNALGISKTSELWYQGEVVTKPELTRLKQNAIPDKERVAMEKAAQERAEMPYDSAFKKWQPVGGRPGNLEDYAGIEADPALRAGSAGAKLLESNADLIIFGHEQDFKVAGKEGRPFELTNKQWVGHKKRVGEMDANNSEMDVAVFNHEMDDFTGIKALEAEMAQLPQFKGAAGKMSSEIQDNNVMQVKESSSSLFTLLKNASDVDEVVFGHDIDASHNSDDRIEHSPLFAGTAGIHSSEKAIAETAMWYGGPKGKAATAIEQLSSSSDMSFQHPTVLGNDWQHTPAFDGGAGAPGKLSNDDGTYRHAHKRFGIKPDDVMLDDFAAYDNSGERGANPNPLPVLSREHGKGSIGAVVFSGDDPAGNREVLGVPNLPADATTLEKREQSRRLAVAQGCRSQAYTRQSEFSNAAGLASDEMYFANSADMVRRVKPVTRKAGYSSVTDVDMVVFGHDLEGGDKDGASLVKDACFAGAAGASSNDIHKTQADSRHAPRDVPQMRDQMDNIVFGREMQDGEYFIRAETAFMEMQRNAGGQASADIGKRGFDRRLEDFGVEGAPDMPLKDNEPRGDLLASRMKGQPREYPAAYAGAIGAERDTLGRIECNSRYVVGSQSIGGRSRQRARNDMDSSDASAVLTSNGERATGFVGHDGRIQGIAGKSSRATNDEAVPLLLADADTETEKKFAERNWSGKNMKATLDGIGYLERDQYSGSAPKKALILNDTTKDSVAELNLLQPDKNDGQLSDPAQWMDGKTNYELYLYEKNFGKGAPYGTDPLDSWYGKMDYTTEKLRTDNTMGETIDYAYKKASHYVSPQETDNGRRRYNFRGAEIKAEYEGALSQARKATGIAKEMPYGVDMKKGNYETSSKVGLQQGMDAWGPFPESLATKIARRRLEKRSPQSSPKMHSGVMVPY